MINYSQQTAQNIIEVGKRLIEAKKQVAHGEWAACLEKKVNYSQSTATRFMKCAERFGNLATLQDLNPSQAFAMLSLPESDTETFIETKAAEGKPVEDMTVKTLREEIKQWKAKAEKAESQIEDLEADIETLWAGHNHLPIGKTAMSH